jgi:hypothetical protein
MVRKDEGGNLFVFFKLSDKSSIEVIINVGLLGCGYDASIVLWLSKG